MSTALKYFQVVLSVVFNNGSKGVANTSVQAANRTEAAKFAKAKTEHRTDIKKASVTNIR